MASDTGASGASQAGDEPSRAAQAVQGTPPSNKDAY